MRVALCSGEPRAALARKHVLPTVNPFYQYPASHRTYVEAILCQHSHRSFASLNL